jgi:ATP-binding cassette subfamily B protein/ATP-binding cassette subfamily C protein
MGNDTKTFANSPIAEALKTCRQGLWGVVAFSLCINLLMLTAPIYMMQVFDRVLSSRSTETLTLLFVVAVLALLTHGTLDVIRGRLFIKISDWLDHQLGGVVLSANVTQALKSQRGPSVQGLRDLATIKGFLTGPAVFPILDAPWAPIFMGVMFLLHPLLGWISLIGAIVLFSLVLINETTSKDKLMKAGGASVAAMNKAEAAARNADVVMGMGMMPNLTQHWGKHAGEARGFQNDASRTSGIVTAASKFFRMVLQVGIMTGGAWLVLQNELTPGAMIAGSILMGRALAPIEQAIGSWKSVVSARGAYARLNAQLIENALQPQSMSLPMPTGKIDVEGVTYAYPQSSEPTIKNVSFSLTAGETLGIVGPTASGKSTLARMLIGNLTPRIGHVRLDDMDVAEWSSEDLGPHIGYLPQDVELFGGTVQENIARLGEASSEDVVAAAQLANVHEMVLRLEKGYDTEIGEGGAALSGGQRQRIGFARALFQSPKLVVLDEPNANLDQKGELALIQAIEKLKEQKTTAIIVAHRHAILQHVDKILVLKDGKVQMFDERSEVLKKISGPQKLAVESEDAPSIAKQT